MATGNTIIIPALRLIGVIAQGETPAITESDDARALLNTLIGNWNIQDLNVLPRRVGTFSLSGANSYTIGSGQTWNTTRPARILAAQHLIATGVVNPVQVVDEAAFARMSNYGQAGGAIAALYYTNTNTGAFTAGTVYVAPAGVNGQSINLFMLDAIPDFPSDLTATVVLPTGYDQALIYNLALAAAPMFGRAAKATPELVQQAADSLAAIRAANVAAKTGTPPGGPVSAAQS